MKTLFISFLVTALVQLANIASGVLAARLLLPEGRGVLALAMLWPTLFAAIGYVSIDQGITYNAASRRETAASLFTAGIALACGLAIITVIAGYFFLPLLIGATPSDVLDDARFYLLFVPVNFVGLTIMAIAIGTMRFGQWNFQRAFAPCLYVIVIIVFYLFGFVSVRSFLISVLLTNFVFVIVGIFLVCRQDGFGALRWHAVSLIFYYSLSVHLALLISIVTQRLDQAVISIYLPHAQLGFYVVAVSIAGSVGLVAGTVGLFVLPKMASQAADGKAIILARYFQLGIAMSLVATIVVFVVSPWLVSELFGTAFDPAVKFSRILLIGAIPASMAQLLATGYRAYGRIAPINYASFAALVVTAGLLLVLVPRYQAAGAAWSVVSAQWAFCLVLLASAGAVLKVDMRTLFIPRKSDIARLADEVAAWIRFVQPPTAER